MQVRHAAHGNGFEGPLPHMDNPLCGTPRGSASGGHATGAHIASPRACLPARAPLLVVSSHQTATDRPERVGRPPASGWGRWPLASAYFGPSGLSQAVKKERADAPGGQGARGLQRSVMPRHSLARPRAKFALGAPLAWVTGGLATSRVNPSWGLDLRGQPALHQRPVLLGGG